MTWIENDPAFETPPFPQNVTFLFPPSEIPFRLPKLYKQPPPLPVVKGESEGEEDAENAGELLHFPCPCGSQVLKQIEKGFEKKTPPPQLIQLPVTTSNPSAPEYNRIAAFQTYSSSEANVAPSLEKSLGGKRVEQTRFSRRRIRADHRALS